MVRLLAHASCGSENALQLCDIDSTGRTPAAAATGVKVPHRSGGSVMKRLIALVYTALLAVSGAALADAPVLKVSKSVTINASADKVWAKAKDFSGLNTWHPAVESDKIIEGTDNKPGAVRLLTLKGGGTIKEKLLTHNDLGHTFKYSILEGVLPVSNYTSTFTVAAEGKNKAKVTWSGSFQRKNTGPSPGEKENDKTATDTMSGVYQSGLDNLKKIVEGK
jgi:mxaD protein